MPEERCDAPRRAAKCFGRIRRRNHGGDPWPQRPQPFCGAPARDPCRSRATPCAGDGPHDAMAAATSTASAGSSGAALTPSRRTIDVAPLLRARLWLSAWRRSSRPDRSVRLSEARRPQQVDPDHERASVGRREPACADDRRALRLRSRLRDSHRHRRRCRCRHRLSRALLAFGRGQADGDFATRRGRGGRDPRATAAGHSSTERRSRPAATRASRRPASTDSSPAGAATRSSSTRWARSTT